MSMNLSIEQLADLADKLKSVQDLDIEVKQIRHGGHWIWLDDNGGKLVVRGISNKEPSGNSTGHVYRGVPNRE